MVTFARICYRDDMRVGGRIVSSDCGMLSFILFIVYLSHSNIYLFGLYNIVLESNKSQFSFRSPVCFGAFDTVLVLYLQRISFLIIERSQQLSFCPYGGNNVFPYMSTVLPF